MATKHTELKPNKATGEYARNIGWKHNEKSSNGSYIPHRFYLGKEKQAAKLANLRLEQLWDQVEKKWTEERRHGLTLRDRPIWDDVTLAMGMAISKGQSSFVLPPNPDLGDDAQLQARYFTRMTTDFPVLALKPINEQQHQDGVERELKDARILQQRAETISSTIGQPIIIGGTLHNALDDYAESVRSDQTKAGEDGERRLTRWGNTQLKNIGRLKERHRDIPLTALDFDQCKDMIVYWRTRPPHKQSKKPLSAKTSSSHLRQLGRFFDWLHRSGKYKWRRPEDLREISRSVELRPDEKAARLTPAQVATYSKDELVLLYKYALPLERLLLLLGLNCGFGKAESGTLRVSELHLFQKHKYAKQLNISSTDEDSYIGRLRTKNGVYGDWKLWPATAEGLKWALDRRKQQTVTKDGDSIAISPGALLLLNGDGLPYIEPTENENDGGQIPNMWKRLTKRIQRDFKDFPYLSFGKLRKTAGNLIRDKSDGEVMAIFHARGRAVTTDDLADVYSNRPFRKVHEAIEEVRKELEPMFNTCTDPFPTEHSKGSPNISRGTIEKIRRLKKDGLKSIEIARLCGVHRATVYRWIR